MIKYNIIRLNNSVVFWVANLKNWKFNILNNGIKRHVYLNKVNKLNQIKINVLIFN